MPQATGDTLERNDGDGLVPGQRQAPPLPSPQSCWNGGGRTGRCRRGRRQGESGHGLWGHGDQRQQQCAVGATPGTRRLGERHDRTRGSSAQRPSSAAPVMDERTLGSPGRCNGKSHTPRKHRCQTQHQEPKPEAAARRAQTAGASVAHWPGLVAATKYTKRQAQ